MLTEFAILAEIRGCLDMLAVHDPQHALNGGRKESKNMWIAKPAAKSRGRGIATFDNLDRMLDHCDAKTGGSGALWIVQKYMESQLFIAKRKFDLRQWVLVTDWNPLTIYFYDECYARFSAEPYSDTRESLENPFVHMVNNSIVKNSDQFHAKVVAENGVEVVDCMWDLENFREFLNWRERRRPERDSDSDRARETKRAATGGDVFRDCIQPKMQEIATRALQCAQEAVEHRRNSWELYGYDFMIDGDLNPWLIEVNSSPACDYSTKVTERYVQKALVDVLKVTVDRRQWEADGQCDDPPDTGGWVKVHQGAFVETPIASLTGGDICCVGTHVQPPKAVKLRLQAAKQAAVAAQRLAATQKRKDLADRHAPKPPPNVAAAPKSPRATLTGKPPGGTADTDGLEVHNGENSPRKPPKANDDDDGDGDGDLDSLEDALDDLDSDDGNAAAPRAANDASPRKATTVPMNSKPSPEKSANTAYAKQAPANAVAVPVTTFEFK